MQLQERTMLLFWFPLAAAIAHIVEEFVWPGGFPSWYRAYRPEIAQSVSTRYLTIINGALLLACASVGLDARTSFGPAFFLTMVALLCRNGAFHLRATLRTKSYSPGVFTGVLLYFPLAAYGYGMILRDRLASPGTAIAAAILGCSYETLALANHRRRERQLRNKGAT